MKLKISLILSMFSSLLALSGGVPDLDEPEVCKNGGEALDGLYSKCSCPYGYKGYDCSEKVSPCDGEPCRNDAECIQTENGTFSCKCHKQFAGKLCEKLVRACDIHPCKNAGNCTNWFDKAFKCDCKDGYKGFDCSQRVEPCEISPCKHGGMCVNQENGGFHCACRRGYRGPICGEKDELFSSLILHGKTDYLQQLTKWLDGETDWRLCYQASKHGWETTDFHSRCDYKGPTLTIIRSGYYIFGGYSDIAWGGSSGYRTSISSFLFSLRNKDNVSPFRASIYQNSKNAVYSNINYGPTFGGGHDIYVRGNSHISSGSYANLGYTYKLPDGYKYGSAKAKTLLAGVEKFIATEIEVYYLD